ncbi:MAG: ArsR/SmtB family transcription factor [Candidatus Promineifilaceae bacterium]|jgi:DNA-binding transcriptional ArsR family regulator
MTTESREQRIFLALADPTRRRLLEMLSGGGRKTAGELAQEMPITRQGVSKHLQVLAGAELVQVQKSGRERYYSFEPESFEEAVNWVTAVHDQWDKRLQALTHFLAEEENKTNGGN